MTELLPHRRGDTYTRSVPLLAGWEWDEFTGGVSFSLYDHIPASDEDTDVPAIYQATQAAGEITYDDDTRMITVRINAINTHDWPARKLYWDLEVRITADPIENEEVYTLDSGEQLIQPDFTRTGLVDS